MGHEMAEHPGDTKEKIDLVSGVELKGLELPIKYPKKVKRNAEYDEMFQDGFFTEKIVDLAKEFDLLVLLLQNKNVALNRSFLYESVWHDWYTGDTRTLDNHIQRLRKKLDWADTIETVFRIGYRLKTH